MGSALSHSRSITELAVIGCDGSFSQKPPQQPPHPRLPKPCHASPAQAGGFLVCMCLASFPSESELRDHRCHALVTRVPGKASPRQGAISSLSFIHDVRYFEYDWLIAFSLTFFLISTYSFHSRLLWTQACEQRNVSDPNPIHLQYPVSPQFHQCPFLICWELFCVKWCLAVLDSAQLDSCYSSKLSAWTSRTKVIIQPCCHSTSMLTFFSYSCVY